MITRTDLPPCKDCGRPVRPQRAPATPGTVRYGARGQCNPCYQAQLRDERRTAHERREKARQRQATELRTIAEQPITTDTPRDPDYRWQDDALCAQVDTDIFFPIKGGSTVEAKTVCRACPARTLCLEFALNHGIEHGVWGGTSERERRKLRRNQEAAA